MNAPALLIAVGVLGCGQDYGSEGSGNVNRRPQAGEEPAALLVLPACVEVSIAYDVGGDPARQCLIVGAHLSGAGLERMRLSAPECEMRKSAGGWMFDCRGTGRVVGDECVWNQEACDAAD